MSGLSDVAGFARWLLTQQERDEASRQVILAARMDRSFPIEGDFEAVWRRFRLIGAEPELVAALERFYDEWIDAVHSSFRKCVARAEN